MIECILKIAIYSPLKTLFDYLPPPSLKDPSKLTTGMRVRVPFGRSTRIGIIAEISQQTDYDINKLKCVEEILDDSALFPDTIQKLIHWSSHYYQSSLGEVFNFALPPWLRKGKTSSEKKNVEETKVLKKKTLEEKALEKKELEKMAEKNKTNNDIILNQEQTFAASTICHHLGNFKTFLLEGITGSGKTEVYIKVIEEVLARNQQALILVPEIGLTPQMLERFESRFHVPIAMLHSAVSEKKRFLAWQMAQTGKAGIVIGTRSALFTPLASPGVFIIDEEHDPSFKQQDSFRYNARDLLVLRGSFEKCPVILGSATPSLETLYNLQQGKFHSLKLNQRAGIAKPPEFTILDIRHKQVQEGLCAQLIHEMKIHLANDGQILLFLNRRGFAPALMCFDCGEVAVCDHCDAKLTLHQSSKRLICHHCESSKKLYEHCPKCNSLNLNPLGIGTERLEAELLRQFPQHGVIRIDRDTTRKKGAMQKKVADLKNGDAQILIGTQMIAKGHHFPNVTLVAILDIDNALFSTDFRSLERLGQLITQVAGRAGRAEKLGSCILQTCHPEHPLLKTLLNKGYAYFAEQLLTERRTASLPPFSHQALIRCHSKNKTQTMNFLQKIKLSLNAKKPSNLHILGPIPAPMERKIGRFHGQLLLQCETRAVLQNHLKSIVKVASDYPGARQLHWSLDIDPIEMA